MILYSTNILVLPLLIVLWSLDAWLLLASIRLIAGQVASPRADQLAGALEAFVDPVPVAIQARLDRWRQKNGPNWVSWAMALAAAVMLRHLLVSLVLATA